MKKIYPINPIGKPRMTQRDKWKGRAVVCRYMSFKDECRLHRVAIPNSGCHITFVFEMPQSWSQRKRSSMRDSPHQSKPDIDNCVKALLDATILQDSVVWDVRATKLWGDNGQIVVETPEAA